MEGGNKYTLDIRLLLETAASSFLGQPHPAMDVNSHPISSRYEVSDEGHRVIGLSFVELHLEFVLNRSLVNSLFILKFKVI